MNEATDIRKHQWYLNYRDIHQSSDTSSFVVFFVISEGKEHIKVNYMLGSWTTSGHGKECYQVCRKSSKWQNIKCEGTISHVNLRGDLLNCRTVTSTVLLLNFWTESLSPTCNGKNMCIQHIYFTTTVYCLISWNQSQQKSLLEVS